MTNTIRVSCLRSAGESSNGTLVDIVMQGDGAKFSPVGIVLLDDNSFQCVPLEFITKITE